MSAADEAQLPVPEDRESGGRITLPPPEWAGPRATDDRLLVEAPSPLDRRVGSEVATQGSLRAEVLASHASHDTVREHAAAGRFARWLAAQGRSWDEAVHYARVALELGEDESLRHELAGWLEGLGESAAAAEVLEPLTVAGVRDSVETVRLLLHMGVLEARAGNARAAAAAFGRAARLDPGEALASELLGTLASWAPSTVTPADAADAYVEAASRRLMTHALEAQMEDLLRAFDVDATSSVAVAALSAALTERGRPLGADEVWRAHASALRPTDEKRRRAVHARRRLQARAAGDLARALGAALDEGLDTVFGAEVGDFMDDLLLRAGLLEPLVARLEIRAESAPRATRAALFEEVARLHAGPLANADRAAAARIFAIEADPTREDALAALRAHASETRDATELVEALIRAVEAPEAAVSATVRLSAAHALAVVADEALNDPMLSAWALAAAGDRGRPTGDASRSEAVRASEQDRQHQKDLLAASEGDARLEPLRALARLLRSCPDQAALNGHVLSELAARVPGERRWHIEAVRLAFRRHDYAEVVRLARAVRERDGGAPIQDLVDAAAVEAAARRAMGDVSGANETTRGLLTKASDDPRAIAIAWMNASLAGDHETRSAAIEHLAKFAGASTRAVLYSVAAEARAAIGDREAPRRLAERACHTDPSSARAVGTLADATVGAHDRTAASALERGIHFLFARSSWCRALAEALDAMGEASYAVGWTQRLVALRPGDRKAMAVLLERVVRTGDGARLAEALIWVLSQPQPAPALIELITPPLRDLVAIDAARAAHVARRALDTFGARLHGLRDAVLAAADAAGDGPLAVMALERALAVEDIRSRGPLLSALRDRQRRAGDAEGEARTLLALARTTPDEATLPAVEALAQVALSSDGALALLEAIAHLSMNGEADSKESRPESARAWRQLGAAQWDLAGDRELAQQSFWRAAKLDPRRGFTTLAFDLAEVGGTAFALDSFDKRVREETNHVRAGMMSAHVARVALALGEPSRAFDFAATALARNPKLSEALEIAESAATSSGREVELTRVYDDLTVRALGRFARRAVNYRGARFFEQQGDHGLALKHAALAFQAVPSEGAALLLLVRTAERAGDRAQAVGAMVQVADATRDAGVRFAWLLRAASATGSDEQGLALRVDVLLHALTVSRDPRASIALQKAAAELLRTAPDEKASLELRLGRASKAVTAKAGGPEGARLALSFARMALELFGDARWASEALASALNADADLEDYETLLPYDAHLAQGGDLEPLFALAVRAYTNVGVAAYRLLARIAEWRGEGSRAADLWSRGAARDPEDSVLVRTADAALRAHGDDEQWARFRKACPDDERARLFHAYANERLRDGAIDDALRALERATELAAADERPAIERELRAAYEASGRAELIEGRAIVEANDATATEMVRAARWAEIAQLRESRGDLAGGLEALLAAADLDKVSVERWSSIERVAAALGREDVRLNAIREVSERLDPTAQAAALKRLARAYEASDDFQSAEATWRRVATIDPDDEEADHAIEALISALRNYADLAAHLERRTIRLAKLPGAREALRAVRLRRAAILEQRLGRTRDACAELALVLVEAPDNVSALSYLADLHERLGEFGRAAPIWQRVALLSRDPTIQNELELRAGNAAMAAEDFRVAVACAKGVLAREPGRRDALELRVSAARALADDEELGDALEELAASAVEEPRLRSDALMEASYSAARAGRPLLGLERARRAAEIAPERTATQLLARTLEYRQRGTGSADDARITMAQLDRVTEEPTIEEATTIAFLRAEALELNPEDGSGLAVLRECQSATGPHALLSLGVAERLAAMGELVEAMAEYEAALSGDLMGLRDRGRVALAAAETAVRAGRDDVALPLFQEAALTPGLRTSALLRAAQIVLARGDTTRSRGILRELATSTEGDDRARALAQIARLERDSAAPADPDHVRRTFDEAIAAVTPGSPLAAQLVQERDSAPAIEVEPDAFDVHVLEAPTYALAGPVSVGRGAPVASSSRGSVPSSAGTSGSVLPASASAGTGSGRPADGRTRSVRPPSLPTPPPPDLSPASAAEPFSIAELERAVGSAATRDDRAPARLSLARAYLRAGAHDAGEACLEAGLDEGGLEEGDVLASLYEAAGRLPEVVRVRRRQLLLASGDLGRLDALRAAAHADRNASYVHALDHVARVFDPSAPPVVPPPLSAQVALPGLLPFLTRVLGDRVAQALALVWEDGYATWGKDAAAVLKGAQPAAASNSEVSRLYETAIGLLGLPRVPLFLRRSKEAPTSAVSFTWPPAAILSGRVDEDTPELRFALGRALALTLPTNVLTLGLDEMSSRNAFRAVMGAFGPPESSRAMNRESGRLAEALWHVLPPRTQRRLQTLLGPVQLEDFESALARSRECANRIGMFLAGDFRASVHAVFDARLRALGAEPTSLYGADIIALCHENAEVADLFQLAVSPEYADARWRAPTQKSTENPSNRPVAP